MKITERKVVTTHEIELSGKKGIPGRSITITLSGQIDVQIGDTYVYRDMNIADLNAERARISPRLEPVKPNYASKEDMAELCDLAIQRYQQLKDSL